MITYKELLQAARNLLREKMIADADADAWYLLSHVFKISRTDYLLYKDNTVSEDGSMRYRELVNLRSDHMPLQYITGTQEFMGLEFEVSPQVLIPRQDTESLVEEVLAVCEGKSVLDMCTGSGCIIISIANLGKPVRAVGADISPDALKIAVRNAVKNNSSAEFIQSNLFEKVEGKFDIIVSNPPYIPTGEIEGLMPEVKDHEPLLALDGAEDGLYFYEKITASLKDYLNRGGTVFYEIGCEQGEAVGQILKNAGFADITVKKDLSGLDRVVTASWP